MLRLLTVASLTTKDRNKGISLYCLRVAVVLTITTLQPKSSRALITNVRNKLIFRAVAQHGKVLALRMNVARSVRILVPITYKCKLVLPMKLAQFSTNVAIPSVCIPGGKVKLAFLMTTRGIIFIRNIMNPASMGPVKKKLKNASSELKLIPPTEKHWLCGGNRSVAIAATLLQQGKVIAVPTDTIYGLAGLASDMEAIERLYNIKKRDECKPLAICLSNVNDIVQWAVTDELPSHLLERLLPGPYTIILRRKSSLNPALNSGIDSVGIRVPNSKFMRSVAKIVGPIALTSANVSNEPSSLHPDEFSVLWPELDGIFYPISNTMKMSEERRVGSTVVDLSQSGCFKIVRYGIGAEFISGILRKVGLKNITAEGHENL